MEQLAPTFDVTYDGAMIRVYHAERGQGLIKHRHVFAHLTMCHAGSCIVRKEGKEMVITKESTPVNLVAGEWHEIEALEDGTVFVNVFAEGKY